MCVYVLCTHTHTYYSSNCDDSEFANSVFAVTLSNITMNGDNGQSFRVIGEPQHLSLPLRLWTNWKITQMTELWWVNYLYCYCYVVVFCGAGGIKPRVSFVLLLSCSPDLPPLLVIIGGGCVESKWACYTLSTVWSQGKFCSAEQTHFLQSLLPVGLGAGGEGKKKRMNDPCSTLLMNYLIPNENYGPMTIVQG
jgi:hypothetical protein